MQSLYIKFYWFGHLYGRTGATPRKPKTATIYLELIDFQLCVNRTESEDKCIQNEQMASTTANFLIFHKISRDDGFQTISLINEQTANRRYCVQLLECIQSAYVCMHVYCIHMCKIQRRMKSHWNDAMQLFHSERYH